MPTEAWYVAVDKVMRRVRTTAHTHLCVECGQPALRLPDGQYTATCGSKACMARWLPGGNERPHQKHFTASEYLHKEAGEP